MAARVSGAVIHHFMNTANTAGPDVPAPGRKLTPAEKQLEELKQLPVVKVVSYEQIARLHDQPIGATVHLYGQNLQFTGRRLLPVEANEIKDLLQRAIPPRKEDGGYDFDNEAYQASRKQHERQARAKCLWLAFPEFFGGAAAAAQKTLTDVAQIQTFIEELKISDEALEALYGAATFSPVSLVELTGFSSGSSSPKS